MMVYDHLMEDIIRIASEKYFLDIDGIHGIGHWKRVKENGLRLASLNAADHSVIEHFAYLHDSCRVSEGIDNEHGKRAAEFIRTIRSSVKLTDKQFELLYEACFDHTDGKVKADITVMTCWDADRLDLYRIGTRPRVYLLCTLEAKKPEVIEWASQRAWPK